MTDLASARRSGRPNDRLMAPPGYCRNGVPDESAPVFAATPERLIAAVDRVAAAEPRTREVGRGPLARQFVQRSRVLRFPDDITVQVLSSDAGATLAIWSRARYGYADFGVNRARVDRWLAAIGAALAVDTQPGTE
ncbi:MAG: DUF1499 domain-containing protein [Roseitalea porphyridii]